MKSEYLAVASLLATLGFASPGSQTDVIEKRQQPGPGSYYAITGARDGVFPRLEVRELAKNADMWNLFLLALTDFQAIDQNQIDSYYQIAGIHGMPWTSWDGVEGRGDRKQMGYCPHFNTLFGIWHRPYVALFEQKLQAVAKTVASKFPTSSRARYENLAKQLRVPYWDWAKNVPASEPVMPVSFTTPRIGVTFPNGTVAQIENPLFDYNFHPLDNRQINGTGCQRVCTNRCYGGLPVICDNSQKTIRRPPPDGTVFESNHPELEGQYRGILASQRTAVYRTLSNFGTFTFMSSAGNCGSGRFGDFETTHNPIHIESFPGHFSPPSVSGFDPIFWLHHANVDRQIALHQKLYPNTYLENCKSENPTFTLETGDDINQDSPLTPFHRNAAGDFWTARNSRLIDSFGYTYPELAGNPSNASLVEEIRRQYGPTTTSVLKKRQNGNGSNIETAYYADIDFPVWGLSDGNGGSAAYTMLFFLGEPVKDVSKWVGSDNFIGLKSTMGGIGMTGPQRSRDTLDLGLAVEKAIKGGKTDEDGLAEYLQKTLQLRLRAGGEEVPRDFIKNITIELVRVEVQKALSNDVFDLEGEPTVIGPLST